MLKETQHGNSGCGSSQESRNFHLRCNDTQLTLLVDGVQTADRSLGCGIFGNGIAVETVSIPRVAKDR